MPAVTYTTQFGSLDHYEKGQVQIIDDDVKHYAFSNCFEIASKAKPYEKVVFGQNQVYALETLRAEVEPVPTPELVTVITPGVATSGAAGDRILMLGRVAQSSVSAVAVLISATRQRRVVAIIFASPERPTNHFSMLKFASNPPPLPKGNSCKRQPVKAR